MRNPLILLILVGGLLAANIALVKAAAANGASPLLAALISTGGAVSPTQRPAVLTEESPS